MKQYRVHYKQKFMGETLEDTYIRSVNHESELIEIENALFDDPHVIFVSFEPLEDLHNS